MKFLVHRSIAGLFFGYGCAREPAPPPAPSPTPVVAEPGERRPLPLLAPMADHQKRSMRDHLVAVQEIVGAVAIEDFAGVEHAALRIGSSAEMGQTCTHMGAAAPGFTEQALGFHRTADGIVDAARRGDRTDVLARLDATLRHCTSCHATWEQHVVDEATWDRLVAEASAPGAAPSD